jgi:hypothetical protein
MSHAVTRRLTGPGFRFLTYKRGFLTIRASSDSPVAQW